MSGLLPSDYFTSSRRSSHSHGSSSSNRNPDWLLASRMEPPRAPSYTSSFAGRLERERRMTASSSGMGADSFIRMMAGPSTVYTDAPSSSRSRSRHGRSSHYDELPPRLSPLSSRHGRSDHDELPSRLSPLSRPSSSRRPSYGYGYEHHPPPPDRNPSYFERRQPSRDLYTSLPDRGIRHFSTTRRSFAEQGPRSYLPERNPSYFERRQPSRDNVYYDTAYDHASTSRRPWR